ncbi:complex III assembly factor LYRM7 isoform X6 [Pseudophryne corroboree]|uniref:complex III assembly factor LYRM7 isoform X6 n=1 Tax=Pseudophryne corroboree TaxID=495146 RepID=UPI0030814C68
MVMGSTWMTSSLTDTPLGGFAVPFPDQRRFTPGEVSIYVLKLFKTLHRTRQHVFQNDSRALEVLQPRQEVLLDNEPYCDSPEK